MFILSRELFHNDVELRLGGFLIGVYDFTSWEMFSVMATMEASRDGGLSIEEKEGDNSSFGGMVEDGSNESTK